MEKDIILIVDDNEINREVIKIGLGDKYEFSEAVTGEEAVSILRKEKDKISLVLLDLMMPGMDGFDVLRWLEFQKWSEFIPVIVVTTENSGDSINRAYEHGAVSFLTRPVQPALLKRNVETFITNYKDLKEKSMKVERAEYIENYDELTGLLNLSSHRELSEKLLKEDTGREYVMAMIDLDYFGEACMMSEDKGDAILVKTAEILNGFKGDDGIAARTGADEFIIFMPYSGDCFELGKKLTDAMRFEVRGVKITASIGLVSTAFIGRRYSDLFLSADYAQFTSKRNGRNQSTVYMNLTDTKKKTENIDEELINNLSQDLPGGFFMYHADNDEKLIYVNSELIKLYGCDSEAEFRELVGDSFKGMVYHEDYEEAENLIDKQINEENGNYDYAEYRIKRKDGSIIWLEDHGRYIFTAEYGYVYYVFVNEIRKNDTKKQKLLVVDDQKINQQILEVTLGDYYDLDMADSGEEAIEILMKNPRAYSAMLLDLIMPGLSGFQVLKYMNGQKDLYGLPVIVISSETNQGSVRKAYEMGASDVIGRPFEASTVRRRIRTCIELFNIQPKAQIERENKKKIIIVDYNNLDRYVITRILSTEYDVVACSNIGDAKIEILHNQDRISLVVLDLRTPQLNGYELLDWMKARKIISQIPVLAESLPGAYEENLHALYAGASDFISKPFRREFIMKRVSSAISNNESSRLVKQMKYDELTGFYTNKYFEHKLEEMLKNTHGFTYDIVWTNIHGFKAFNDIYGNSLGDETLKYMSSTIKKHSGALLFGREGSDHFVFVMPHTEGGTYKKVLKINSLITKNTVLPYINAHYGIYEKIDPKLPVKQIVDRAKIAGKTGRTNSVDHCVSFYDERIRDAILKDQRLTEQMDAALKEKQFVVYYQPKISMESGKVAGMEALVRWKHPQEGFISPGDFIPLFENNGFVRKVDKYIFAQVCDDIKEWESKGFQVPPISVNISRRDFEVKDYLEQGVKLMESKQVTSSQIHIEVTESVYSENMNDIIRQLNFVRDKGIKVEMDDFGSGYSSLGLLTDMPMDIVKLDITFVRDIKRKYEVVRSVIELSHRLGYKVVAEGAENREQVELLKELNCDYVQGFYFSKPVPKEDILQYLEHLI